MDDNMNLPEVRMLTDKQEEAIRYLASGITAARTAKALGVKKSEIEKWISDEAFSHVLMNARNSAIGVQGESMRQLMIPAMDRLWEILSVEYDKASPEAKKEIARTARFVVERALGDGSKGGGPVQNNVIVPGVYINNDSAEVIARHVSRLQSRQEKTDEIDAEFRISSVDEALACHPETDYGAINYDEERDMSQCHICGKWVSSLEAHSGETHSVPYAEYKRVFRIQ